MPSDIRKYPRVEFRLKGEPEERTPKRVSFYLERNGAGDVILRAEEDDDGGAWYVLRICVATGKIVRYAHLPNNLGITVNGLGEVMVYGEEDEDDED